MVALEKFGDISLADGNADKVEEAYLRSDLFDKRRVMMDDWAKFCTEA